MDLGTGDGRFVLATATASPDTFVIGIDADTSSMAEASRRAARPVKKGGLPNALFVVAAAESLPSELNALADSLTIHFPWGSLLRGLLHGDPAILDGIARITRPTASVTLLLSVTGRDHVAELDSLDGDVFAALAPIYAAFGLVLCGARPATAADLTRSHSTWAKRLGAGESRPAWFVRFQRDGEVHSTSGECRHPLAQNWERGRCERSEPGEGHPAAYERSER